MNQPRRQIFTGKRLARFAIVGSLLLSLGAYGFNFWRFHGGKITLSRNISREMNAHLEHVPEDERAWTILSTLTGDRSPDTLDVPADQPAWNEVFPGDELWPAAREFAASRHEVLADVRRAAARPFMGQEIRSETDEENPLALSLLMPALGRTRACARLLVLDMRIAADDQDADRVLTDFEAIAGLAELTRDNGLMIADLVSIAIFALDLNEIGRIVSSQPGLLDDAHLARLQSCIRSFNGGPLVLRAQRDQDTYEDMIQRIFTDDGNGDGRICAEGVRNLQAMGGDSSGLSPVQIFVTPLNLGSFATRRQCTAAVNNLFACFRADAETPRWERQFLFGEAEAERLSQISRPKLLKMFGMIGPAFVKALAAFDHVEMSRGAALAGLALERYRLRHGRYPASLDALVPEFLDAIPLDHFTGGPLSMAEADGRPVIYAFGCDLDDDGGIPPRRPMDAIAGPPINTPSSNPAFNGDLILWPAPQSSRPATPAVEPSPAEPAPAQPS